MCCVSTPYYLLCGCYGKKTLVGEPCVRSTSQRGLSQGCWDQIDLGVESIAAVCPKFCTGIQLHDRGSLHDLVRSVTPRSEASETSNTRESSSTTTSRPQRSTSDCVSPLLSCLSTSLTPMPLSRSDSAVSLPSQSSEIRQARCRDEDSHGTPQSTINLHWRMFDQRRYHEIGKA